mmetsp:Transcript_14680/g.25993  ORF Transcript_14680/g.25993 Transcript_14680/m.25993 type:complete len:123 (-) Transcript_14680:43-411(-)
MAEDEPPAKKACVEAKHVWNSIERPEATGPTKCGIEIQYSEEYGEHAQAAIALIKKNFPASMFPEAELVFDEIKDSEKTDKFEIKVDGKLLHSKKTKDHDFFHLSKPQQKVVFAAIEDVIDD